MSGYMERCRVCGCWTDYNNKARPVCDDCQRAVAVAVGAVQTPDVSTLQARITTLEDLLHQARLVLEQARGALLLDTMTDATGAPYITTTEALHAIDAALDIEEGESARLRGGQGG